MIDRNESHSLELSLVLHALYSFMYLNGEIDESLDISIFKKTNLKNLKNIINDHEIHLIFSATKYHEMLSQWFPKFHASFQLIKKRMILKNLRLSPEIFRIQKCFQEIDVQILPYKGIPFSIQFYNSINQRQNKDIDFAIHLDDMGKIADVMKSLSYVPSKGEFNAKSIKSNRAYYLDYPWELRDDQGIKFNIDFHWKPSHHTLYQTYEFNEGFPHVETVSLDKISIDTFNNVHHALIAIIHHGLVDGWGKLKHLVDFEIILKKLDEKDLLLLEGLCLKFRLMKVYYCGRYLTNIIFKNGNNQLKTSRKDELIYMNVLTNLLDGKVNKKWSEQPSKIFLYLKMRDSFSDQLKSLRNIISYGLKK